MWQWRYLGRIAIRRWQERAEAVPVFPNALSAEPLGFFAGTVHALGIKGGIYRPGARGPLRRNPRARASSCPWALSFMPSRRRGSAGRARPARPGSRRSASSAGGVWGDDCVVAQSIDPGPGLRLVFTFIRSLYLAVTRPIKKCPVLHHRRLLQPAAFPLVVDLRAANQLAKLFRPGPVNLAWV